MAKTKKNTSDMVIVGGGVAGLTLATLLSGIGMQIHLIEPHPPEPFSTTDVSGRTVALMQSSLNILNVAGLSKFCAEYGTPLERMQIYDQSIANQPAIISEFDSFDLGLEYFGRNIPNALLRAKLYEQIQNEQSITVHSGKNFESFTKENATSLSVRLNDDTQLNTKLLIGADGRSSSVRTTAQIKTNKKTYDQSALSLIHI